MEHNHNDQMGKHHYVMLGVSTAISAVIMYVSMFAMIDTGQDFFNNINMFYMALLMAAPMVILMLVFMGSMYSDKPTNIILYAISALIFLGSLAGIRLQTAVGDKQFLKSMIPHHSGAILMCRQAQIKDPEITKLCGDIVKSQREEISQMRKILSRL